VSLKKNENKELKKFWKHTSVTTLSYSNLIEKHFSVHFNMEALELGTETLYLLHGINYDANEESGLGQGRVYATPTFLGQQNIVRHDFVEVKIKDNDEMEHTQVAQALIFLEYCVVNDEKETSNFFALVQFLEPDDNSEEENLFIKMKW
jgi:hypothetical protein